MYTLAWYELTRVPRTRIQQQVRVYKRARISRRWRYRVNTAIKRLCWDWCYNRLLQWVVTRLHKSQQMALSLASLYTVSPTFHAVGSDYFNPIMGTCNYNATSNNMKLVHWSLIGGLLHLAHQWGYWPQPAQAPPRCTKCNSPPINGQCTNHRISV